MAKPTGFLEYERETATYRDPIERVKDWDHLQLPVTSSLLKEQSARCMDCGIPFCHTGRIENGMTTGCPINNLIPEWNDLVYRGLWKQAYERLAKTNNFPEFTGMVCPAPCEGGCTLGITDPPVTIKSIEMAIIERAFDEGWVQPRMPDRRTGKRVAVVGSGPSGLACAEQLNQAGHHVSVLERDDRIGGLLMYGIPNMKLDKSLVERRLDLMREAEIEFITNAEAGVNYPVEVLREDYDAIVLCLGSTKPRDLRAPGRDFYGIHFAMDYLLPNTRSLLNSHHDDGQYINAAGKDVIVIGGGDTGTDCVGTALRQGCASLVQFEIMPKPPLSRADDNPWPQWPRVYKLDYGQEEAKAIYGDDPRQYKIMTKEFVGDRFGQVKGIRTVEVSWEHDPNQWRPVLKELPGTEQTWQAQLVLLAMGYLGPEQQLLEKLSVETDPRSTAKAAHGKFMTSVEGVFAAGDCRRGQSLVVWAINEGRGAARECDRWLMGETTLP